jgi:Uma2 family endonuclease
MTAVRQPKTMNAAEYLEFEKTSSSRHEFVDGVLHAMAGEKKRHNTIAGRILRALADVAEAKNCQVYMEGVKLHTRGKNYRYPDVIVTCEEEPDEYLVFKPCALFEVLSSSPEGTDSEDKVEEYLRLKSLTRYVLVRQDRKVVTVYKRDALGWRVEFLEDEGEIELPCLGMNLSLEEIYAGLEF